MCNALNNPLNVSLFIESLVDNCRGTQPTPAPALNAATA